MVFEDKQLEEVVGLIARIPGDLTSLSTNEQKNGALIIVVNDLEPQTIMVGEAASSDGESEPRAASGRNGTKHHGSKWRLEVGMHAPIRHAVGSTIVPDVVSPTTTVR